MNGDESGSEFIVGDDASSSDSKEESSAADSEEVSANLASLNECHILVVPCMMFTFSATYLAAVSVLSLIHPFLVAGLCFLHVISSP